MKPRPFSSLVKKPALFDGLSVEDARAVPDFLRRETVGGLLMLAATLIAVTWTNFWHGSYEHVRHLEFGGMSLQHWCGDGLLTVFFFVAGLELKRELTSGSLSRPAEATVPIVAALCGMIVPAGAFLLVNGVAPSGRPEGWAIPMATDIAFALAVLAAFGSHLPDSLRAFLLTLAIVDDLGAIIVIAVAFTDTLHWTWLAGGLGCAVLWWLAQRRRIRAWWLYVPLFLLTWWCVLQSGVHATIAGVVLGLLSRSDPHDDHDSVDRWEHFWHPVSAGLVVPIFALFTAGVKVSGHTLSALVTNPISIGIVVGLVLGKPLGVFGGAWLTARLTKASLAEGLKWREVFAVGVLAGVGFTVALFISELAFPADPELIEQATAAVLVASLLSAVLAAVALYRRSNVRKRSETDAGG